MADRVIDRTQTETPRDTVVVHDDRNKHSNVGLIIGIILVALLLLFFFGG